MKSIEVLGAAGGEVTGSALLLTSNKETKFLVECGMFQGKKHDGRNKTLNGHDTSKLDFSLITHAHADHVGRLPHVGGESSIYATPATRDLTDIFLKDTDERSPGLYRKGSVSDVLSRIVRVPYNFPIEADGLKIAFSDAGHILGSASIEIQEKGGDVMVFSGDLGNSRSRTVRPATPLKKADIVIMETTYGDRENSHDDPVEVVADAVERIMKTRGTLLIPAFAVDRTQAILSILKELRKKNKLGKIPVFLDSPLAIRMTEIYSQYGSLLKNELREEKKPFEFPGLYRILKSKDSKKIRNRRGPKIIIAGAGMMDGGRMPTHAADYLPESKSVILFVGYSVEGTLSRKIIEGAKEVQIGNELVDVDATVLRTSSLSAHADQQQLLNWLRHIADGERRLRKVILLHGSDPAREKFAHKIRLELGIDDVSLPKENEIIELQ